MLPFSAIFLDERRQLSERWWQNSAAFSTIVEYSRSFFAKLRIVLGYRLAFLDKERRVTDDDRKGVVEVWTNSTDARPCQILGSLRFHLFLRAEFSNFGLMRKLGLMAPQSGRFRL